MTNLTATIDNDASEAMQVLANLTNPALVVHESTYRVEIEANGDLGDLGAFGAIKAGSRRFETFKAAGFSRAYYVAKDFLQENINRDGFNTWRLVSLMEITK